MDLLGRDPAPWTRLKLSLRWVVFEDQFGNFVLVDPQRPRPMGMEQEAKRPPTVYFAATAHELDLAMETMLYYYEVATNPTRAHRDLVERVQEARDRHRGVTGKEHRKAA